MIELRQAMRLWQYSSRLGLQLVLVSHPTPTLSQHQMRCGTDHVWIMRALGGGRLPSLL